MSPEIKRELWRELVNRGFTTSGAAPNDTMGFDETFLDGVEIGDLFDTLVSRREKIFRSVDVVGQDVAKRSYDDVVIAIESIKCVIRRLSSRP